MPAAKCHPEVPAGAGGSVSGMRVTAVSPLLAGVSLATFPQLLIGRYTGLAAGATHLHTVVRRAGRQENRVGSL